ncbi:hypothetical protein, partial [uncultured Vibrio sp.]|uniref:hypothetical protein n=1 Tax=uncultured Vibrio sp. TaxID=114054 RepID=UPI002629D9C8
HPKHTQKKRDKRPLAALNRAYLKNLLKCPSKSALLTSAGGRTTQERFLKDIFIVMDVLVSQMCSRTRKIGTSAKNGFFLFTWARIAELSELPEWRVKQCYQYLNKKGWVISKQPWTLRAGKDGKVKKHALTSIKRVTLKYFEDMGLTSAFEAARRAGEKTIKARAKRFGKAVKYILTPISLLNERRKAKADALATSSPPI